MKNLKSLAKLTVTVNGVERPMTDREKRWVSFLFPFVARQIAKQIRTEHPLADNEEITEMMRSDLGTDPDPQAMKLVGMVADRLPPPAEVRKPATGSPASIWVLVVANLVPVWGVLILGWEVFPLVLLFWLENVTIGILNVARMLCADPADTASWAAKLFFIPFFCFHYGMFTGVHGIFVFALFGGKGYHVNSPLQTLDAAQHAVAEYGLGLPVLVLAGSHLFSFVWNYLRGGEYRSASLQELMGKPYSRVVVLHLGIIAGGFIIMALHSPLWALLLLVGLKIAFDVRAHQREHRLAVSG